MINTQHKDFHYLICLYSCKTVVFIIIYSSLEMISELDVSESSQYVSELAPVVQRLDNAIHRINHYPADKC